MPREAKEEFVESSRKLFSADLDAPIEGAELEVSRPVRWGKEARMLMARRV